MTDYNVPEHISALTSLCAAKAAWSNVSTQMFFDQKVPPHMFFADVIGTTPIIRFLWKQLYSISDFFKVANIFIDDLLNNSHISFTLVKWFNEFTSIPHLLCIWDFVAYRGCRVTFNHLKWFNVQLHNTCKDLIHGSKVFVPRHGYHPFHPSFGDDTVNNIYAWKYWIITPKEREIMPKTPAPPPVNKKDMKKKFKKLLAYKLCDKNEADIYEQLIKTLETIK